MQDPAATSRSHTALCLATMAFAVAFALTTLVSVPILWYHPLEGVWRVEAAPTTLAMGWYGRLLWGVVAAGIGFGLGRLLPARLAATRRAQAWWALAAMALVVAAMASVVVAMAERTLVPLAPPGAASAATADERTLVADELLE